jgi:hypothetical protein
MDSAELCTVVIPVEAGIHSSRNGMAAQWIPAFGFRGDDD